MTLASALGRAQLQESAAEMYLIWLSLFFVCGCSIAEINHVDPYESSYGWYRVPTDRISKDYKHYFLKGYANNNPASTFSSKGGRFGKYSAALDDDDVLKNSIQEMQPLQAKVDVLVQDLEQLQHCVTPLERKLNNTQSSRASHDKNFAPEVAKLLTSLESQKDGTGEKKLSEVPLRFFGIFVAIASIIRSIIGTASGLVNIFRKKKRSETYWPEAERINQQIEKGEALLRSLNEEMRKK